MLVQKFGAKSGSLAWWQFYAHRRLYTQGYLLITEHETQQIQLSTTNASSYGFHVYKQHRTASVFNKLQITYTWLFTNKHSLSPVVTNLLAEQELWLSLSQMHKKSNFLHIFMYMQKTASQVRVILYSQLHRSCFGITNAH